MVIILVVSCCSNEGSNIDPTMVPAVSGTYGGSQKIHVDDIPEHRVCGRAGSTEGNWEDYKCRTSNSELPLARYLNMGPVRMRKVYVHRLKKTWIYVNHLCLPVCYPKI